MKFKLGDYVKVTRSNGYISKYKNQIGRIVAIRAFDYVVFFNEFTNGMHRADIISNTAHIEEYYEDSTYGNYKYLKERKGLYLDKDDLELVNMKKGNRNLFNGN